MAQKVAAETDKLLRALDQDLHDLEQKLDGKFGGMNVRKHDVLQLVKLVRHLQREVRRQAYTIERMSKGKRP